MQLCQKKKRLIFLLVSGYMFGNCSLMKHGFKFNKHRTLCYNLNAVLNNKENYNKLTENYNILNKPTHSSEKIFNYYHDL